MAGQAKRRRPGMGRRQQILRRLQRSDSAMTIIDLAEQLRVHPNTVRFHLDTLVESGQVKRIEAKTNSRGRPPLLFEAIDGMDPAGPRRYDVLAQILAFTMGTISDGPARASQAGHMWGERTAEAMPLGKSDDAALDNMMSMLESLDFAPEATGDVENREIGVRHCPFLDMTRDGESLVCTVHRGLMEGALSVWQPDASVEDLQAFVEPGLCVAHLRGI